MRIRYTRRALAQLDEIYSYIETHDPGAAARVKARIKRAIERLALLSREHAVWHSRGASGPLPLSGLL